MINTAFSFSFLLYLLIPVAFLLGSIPFGIIFTRSKGIDLRSAGSKNIGATNVLRAAGKIPALLTLLGDLLKGTLAVVLCKIVIMKINHSNHLLEIMVTVEDLWLGIVGLSVVLGHMFSVFLSFKGGKGVATGFGVLLVYSPAVGGITLLIWIAVALIFRYSSLAAICAVSLMPIVFILFNASIVKIVFGILLALLVIYKHKSNIKNLVTGVETRI